MLPKTIKINEDLSNEEQPIQILDRKEHGLLTKNILMVKSILEESYHLGSQLGE